MLEITRKDLRPDSMTASSANAFDVDLGLSLRAAIAGLKRQYKVIGAVILAMLAVGTAYIVTAESRFTATARIIIDPRIGGGPNQPTAPMLLLSDELLVDSEVEVIRSRELIGRLIDQLQLLDNPLVNERPSPLVSAMSGVRELFDAVLLDFVTPTPELSEEEARSAHFERVKSTILDSLVVARAGSTYAIDISYTSPERGFSAKMANAIIEQYFALQAEAAYENTRRVSQWLSERVSLLSDEVLQSDRAVEDYKRSNNLINVREGRLPTDIEFEATNQELVAIRSKALGLEVRIAQLRDLIAQRSTNASIESNAVTSSLTELQERFADLVGRERDLSSRFGTDHQLARRARVEIATVRGQIVEEYEKIAAAQGNQLTILRQQEEDLLRRMGSLREVSSENANALIKLRELEREATSDRQLYETMLRKLNETAQEQTFRAAPARIIARAAPPEQKSEPRTKVILVLALFGGLVLGVGGAFLREQLDSNFRMATSVRDDLGVPLIGIIPTFATDRRKIAGRGSKPFPVLNPATIKDPAGRKTRNYRFAAEYPASMFAETLRSLAFAITANKESKRGKVIAITSLRKGEGKSVLSGNLATYSSVSGNRVALVDYDVRGRTLTSAFSVITANPQLSTLVTEPHLTAQLTPDPLVAGAVFVPNNGDTNAHNAGDRSFIVGLERLIDKLRGEYDLVVVDLPPLANLVDARIAASMVDHVVIAIEWGQTKRAALSNLIHGSQMLHSKIIGAIYTKVPFALYEKYNLDSSTEYYDYLR